jgi:cytochrome P450
VNSTAASWALYAIAENPEIQTRLRNELLAVDNDNPTMEDLNALPYLDCVVRETLRAHSPVIASCEHRWLPFAAIHYNSVV